MSRGRGQRRNVCRYFSSSGNCYYGDQCQFLHVSGHSNDKQSDVGLHQHAVGQGPKGPVERPFYGNDVGRIHHLSPFPSHPPMSNPVNRMPTGSFHLPMTGGHSPQKPPMRFTERGEIDSTSYAEKLRKDLLYRQQMCECPPPADWQGPKEVEEYHSLCPLEESHTPNQLAGQLFAHQSTCYRAVSNKDSKLYCLRRFHNFRLSTARAAQEADKWRSLPRHANVVPLVEMFTTKAFGDRSLVFVFEFISTAKPIAKECFNPPWFGLRPLSESKLWQLAVQLVSGVYFVHTAQLAVRCLHASKIIVVGGNRLWFSCGGVVDVLMFDMSNPGPPLSVLQGEDLVALGHLLVCLALQSSNAADSEMLPHSLEVINMNFSEDVQRLVQHLLKGNGPQPQSIVDVVAMVSSHSMAVLEQSLRRQDKIESELTKQIHNGRLFRLLAKLGFINERPNFRMDPNWSETGDKYMLKLFRDHLFHQVLPSGLPWIDLSHVVQSLDKVDVMSTEGVCLSSTDTQSLLVVSYADISRCLETSFNELLEPFEENQSLT